MKSKSPFSKNTPLKEIEIFQGSTSTYRHPSTVIQPIVGAKVGKKLTDVGNKMVVEGIKAMPGKKPEPRQIQEISSVIKPSKGIDLTPKGRELEIKQKNISKYVQTPSTHKTSLKEAYTKRDMEKYGNMTFEQYKAVAKKDPLYGTSGTKGGLKKMESTVTYIDGKKALQTPYKQVKNNSLAINMNGSPAKQIDPYAAINPEAVPGAQAQNVLGAQPIVGANLNQARNVDMQAMIDPYKSPGATFKPGEKLKAENIYGQAGQRQALMNLGSPMHAHTPDHDKKSDSLAMKGPLYHKGHPDDYDGHTHRKIGKSYEVGDYMDQTDMDKKFPKLWSEDVGRIQKDKVSQFMISKNKDYNPTKIDTIRPVSGKTFKMTWGDAERNISTNPKYKKSK